MLICWLATCNTVEYAYSTVRQPHSKATKKPHCRYRVQMGVRLCCSYTKCKHYHPVHLCTYAIQHRVVAQACDLGLHVLVIHFGASATHFMVWHRQQNRGQYVMSRVYWLALMRIVVIALFFVMILDVCPTVAHCAPMDLSGATLSKTLGVEGTVIKKREVGHVVSSMRILRLAVKSSSD